MLIKDQFFVINQRLSTVSCHESMEKSMEKAHEKIKESPLDEYIIAVGVCKIDAQIIPRVTIIKDEEKYGELNPVWK